MMMIIIKKIKCLISSYYNKYKQLIFFGLVGCINTGVDFAFFTLLHTVLGVGSVISQGISYFLGVVNSYLLNRTLTFKVKTKMNGSEFLKFCVINSISWGVSIGIIYIFERYIPVSIYLGKVVASLCALVINFIGSKLYVFGDSDN